MHSTNNLEDGYIGSGKRLRYSINKYGKNNHICEILEFLPDRNSLKAREKEIVNEEMVNDKMCMNLALGGEGGSGSKFLTKEQLQRGAKAMLTKIWLDPDYLARNKTARSIRFKKYWTDPEYRSKIIKNLDQTGKNHTEESKRKIGAANSIKQKGANNSQYGKCWITNGIESQKIYKGDSIPEGWKLGRKMN